MSQQSSSAGSRQTSPLPISHLGIQSQEPFYIGLQPRTSALQRFALPAFGIGVPALTYLTWKGFKWFNNKSPMPVSNITTPTPTPTPSHTIPPVRERKLAYRFGERPDNRRQLFAH